MRFEFEEGDIVYLRTDTEQYQRVVTGYLIGEGSIKYRLACDVDEPSYHFAVEISATKIVF